MGNEEGKKIKVRVTNRIWIEGITKNHPDKIGDNYVVLVEDYPDSEETDYRIVGTHYGIPKTDCTIIDEPTSDAPKVNPITEAIKKTIDDVNILAKTNEYIGEAWKVEGGEGVMVYSSHDANGRTTYNAFKVEPKVSLDLTKDKRDKLMSSITSLEKLHKMQKPTESSRSERIEISIDGNTYYINRKAWEMEQTFRKLRNQLYERQISQDDYDYAVGLIIQNSYNCKI